MVMGGLESMMGGGWSWESTMTAVTMTGHLLSLSLIISLLLGQPLMDLTQLSPLGLSSDSLSEE